MIPLPNTIKKSNIWEEAAKQKEKDVTAFQVEKTLIVVGQPSSGKSSFIQILKSNSDAQTKPTSLMDYTYIKKVSGKKQLIHCYEIATKTLTQTVCSLVSKDNFASTCFIICIDLGKPETAIEDLLQWVDILRKQGQNIINERLLMSQQKYEQFANQIQKKYAQNEDRDAINQMPLNTIVIGCKYDIFQRYDTQSRKWFSKALRYISHINNMSLYFCSTKNMQVTSYLKTYFQQKLFQQKKTGISSQFDHTKPIFVNNGDDTIRQMNLPSMGSVNKIEILKKQLISLFGQKSRKKKEPLDIQKYEQGKIDGIIREKKKELQKAAKLLQANRKY